MLRKIRSANKIWLFKPIYRRIQQENIKMDITETGYEWSRGIALLFHDHGTRRW
jgi:hypothetical protein